MTTQPDATTTCQQVSGACSSDNAKRHQPFSKGCKSLIALKALLARCKCLSIVFLSSKLFGIAVAESGESFASTGRSQSIKHIDDRFGHSGISDRKRGWQAGSRLELEFRLSSSRTASPPSPKLKRGVSGIPYAASLVWLLCISAYDCDVDSDRPKYRSKQPQLHAQSEIVRW
nr:hypothetical protein CFP56_53556 [Quercus suber]